MVLKYQKNADGLYVCNHCEFTSGPQSTMHYHLKTQHGGELKHSCKFCDSKFIQKQLLDYHMNSRHKDELDKRQTQFKCPFPKCETHDLRKGNIISHFMRIHLKDLVDKALVSETKETRLSCKCCNKSFASKPSFNYHLFSCIKPDEKHPIHGFYVKLVNLEAST